MDTTRGPTSQLSRFADHVLFRARSRTGVAVYEHADGSRGFLSKPGDVGVTRTVRRTVSFKARCRACGVTVATCTAGDVRVTTPCLCAAEREWRDAAERSSHLVGGHETDVDSFTARVYEELSRDEPFLLFGMVRGFVRRYWPIMGSHPDPRLWARFYRRRC